MTKVNINTFLYIGICFVLMGTACNTKYRILSIEGQYIPVTQSMNPDPEAITLVEKYKSHLEEKMNHLLGYAEVDMQSGRPESVLTNFTSDVMLTLDTSYTAGQPIDITFMNVGGLRAPIMKGEVRMGDLYNTYSFENELVVIRLKGKYVREIFDSYAKRGGGGVSSTARLRIKDKTVREASIHSEPIQDDRIYTIVTLDYLAEGNDGMQALTKAESIIPTGITLRDFMIEYVRSMQAKGQPISAVEDQRIRIEE